MHQLTKNKGNKCHLNIIYKLERSVAELTLAQVGPKLAEQISAPEADLCPVRGGKSGPLLSNFAQF